MYSPRTNEQRNLRHADKLRDCHSIQQPNLYAALRQPASPDHITWYRGCVVSDPEVTMTARRGWTALAAFVITWDILCDEPEMLSRGMDRLRRAHPILAWAIVGATAGHLLRVLPPWADPYQVLHLARMR